MEICLYISGLRPDHFSAFLYILQLDKQYHLSCNYKHQYANNMQLPYTVILNANQSKKKASVKIKRDAPIPKFTASKTIHPITTKKKLFQ